MKRSWEIIAELLTANIKRILAQAFGVSTDTVGAWGRDPESESNPFGTGKRNPIDQIERLIRIAHRYAPGIAREIAQFVVDLVDRLDREAGIDVGDCEENACVLLAQSVKEHTDVVTILIENPDDPRAWQKARKEIPESISKLNQLYSCIGRLLAKGKF